MKTDGHFRAVLCVGIGASALLGLLGMGFLRLLPTSSECIEMACRWDGRSYRLVPLEASCPPAPCSTSRADLDGDGVDETVRIVSGRAMLYRNGGAVWRSPRSWLVTQALFADSNHDGRIELNIVLWKHGTYGPDRPFFVKKPDKKWGCHIFLYAWRAKVLRCIWGASTIDFPICEAAFADLRGDGKPDLVVLESLRGSDEHAPASYVAVWRWNGWGFTNQFRSKRGRYTHLHIAPSGDKQIALVRRKALR